MNIYGLMNLFNNLKLSEEVVESVSEGAASANEAAVSANVIEELASLESVEEIQTQISAFQKYMEGLPEKLINFGIKFIVAILILFIGGKLINLLRKIVKKALQLKNTEVGVIQFLDVLIKYILSFCLIVIIAGFFGFQTTSLIALLGSAGVAFALALQGSLSNFTGGVLILLLKPFKIGDYIKEDNKGNEGTVIEIHLFYTKLQTVDDRIVILPNGTLANTSLTNVNLSPQRRLIMQFGISYDSDIKKAKAILKELVDKNDKVLRDKPVDIFVDSLDESQVTLCVRFFVKNEYYFDAKWAMTEDVKLEFDKAGIEIPFNQMDVHMINN